MSQFEFISVAQSLICAMIAARVLSLLAGTGSADRSYSVHTAWLFFCLVAATVNWWMFWSYIDVAWNYQRFVLSLSPTGFVFMMAATMAPSDSNTVVSWRDYYYKNKNRFFAYGAGYTLALGACTYFLLDVPVWQPRMMGIPVLLAISGTGCASSDHRVHVLVAATWVLVLAAAIIGVLPLDLRALRGG